MQAIVILWWIKLKHKLKHVQISFFLKHKTTLKIFTVPYSSVLKQQLYVIARYNKARYNEHTFSVHWDFIKSRFHCIMFQFSALF